MNQFKRAQVVILPTQDEDSTLEIDDLSINILSLESKRYVHKHPQHLYIILDDKIKGDDWFIYNNIVYQCKSIKNGWRIVTTKGHEINNTLCNKIIVTTDSSLTIKHINNNEPGSPYYEENLPQPSQQFIEKYIESYNKGEVITDVLVEYEEYNHHHINYNTDGRSIKNASSTWRTRLKVNLKDNTITIKKVKDSWNREEIRLNFMYGLSSFAAERNLTPTPKEMKEVNEWGNNWIKNNL